MPFLTQVSALSRSRVSGTSIFALGGFHLLCALGNPPIQLSRIMCPYIPVAVVPAAAPSAHSCNWGFLCAGHMWLFLCKVFLGFLEQIFTPLYICLQYGQAITQIDVRLTTPIPH